MRVKSFQTPVCYPDSIKFQKLKLNIELLRIGVDADGKKFIN